MLGHHPGRCRLAFLIAAILSLTQALLKASGAWEVALLSITVDLRD